MRYLAHIGGVVIFLFALCVSVEAVSLDSRVQIKKSKNGRSTVLIQTRIIITGDGANKWRARSIQRTVDWVFNSKPFLSGKDTVRFNITYEYMKDITKGDLRPGDNILVFSKEKEEYRYGSYVMGVQESGHVNGIKYSKSLTGAKGEIIGGYRYNNNVIIHETLHFLGISDRYVNHLDKEDNIILSRSLRGYEHDIMGVSNSLNVHPTHIKNIVRWGRENYPIRGERVFVNKEVIDKLWNGKLIN